MTKYMLDTDICSYLIRGMYPELQKKVLAHQKQIVLSAITQGELLYGAQKKKSKRLLEAVKLYLSFFPIIPWDEDAALEYAIIRDTMTTQGLPIGTMDMLIAASARASDCHLVTHNTAHFGRITTLHVTDWLAPLEQ